jgi:hypothetical protein
VPGVTEQKSIMLGKCFFRSCRATALAQSLHPFPPDDCKNALLTCAALRRAYEVFHRLGSLCLAIATEHLYPVAVCMQ